MLRTSVESLRRVTLVPLVLIWALLGDGCVSRQVRLPRAPDTPADVGAAGAPTLGLAPVRDARPNEAAGYVGALKLTAGAEAKDYLLKKATRALYEKGYHVVSSPDPSGSHGAGHLFKAKIIVLTLQTLSMEGEGLGPVQATTTLTAQVYDESETLAYVHTFQGSSNDHFGLSANPDALAGKIMAAALDQAIATMIADTRFVAAMH